jgi:hypothetical protein
LRVDSWTFTIRKMWKRTSGKVSQMETKGANRMEKQAATGNKRWAITVESRNEQHQAIILATIAKRAYQLFEERGCAHGSDREDWITAEKELLQNDFNGNTSQFDLFIESPRDLEVTTILSMTPHSMIVFRSYARHNGEIEAKPDVASVHVFPEEIDTTQAEVNRVDGLLHVHVPKKNHRNATRPPTLLSTG